MIKYIYIRICSIRLLILKKKNLVDNILDLLGSNTFWIGFHKYGSIYRCDEGTPVNFTYYRQSQPDNCCPLGAATCTLVNYIGYAGQWDDAGYNNVWRHRSNIVCKKPMHTI